MYFASNQICSDFGRSTATFLLRMALHGTGRIFSHSKRQNCAIRTKVQTPCLAKLELEVLTCTDEKIDRYRVKTLFGITFNTASLFFSLAAWSLSCIMANDVENEIVALQHCLHYYQVQLCYQIIFFGKQM